MNTMRFYLLLLQISRISATLVCGALFLFGVSHATPFPEGLSQKTSRELPNKLPRKLPRELPRELPKELKDVGFWDIQITPLTEKDWPDTEKEKGLRCIISAKV